MTWLNGVDQSYRDEFRDLFESNFGRFEARMAQQSAELRAEFDRKLSRVETRLVRWMFTFWVTTLLAVAGTTFAVLRAR